MTSFSNNSISDLENLIAETICLKIENWNLYLGDAGLARKLAIECLSNISRGTTNAVKISLENVYVSIGEDSDKLKISKFIIASQKKDLEKLLEDFI